MGATSNAYYNTIEKIVHYFKTTFKSIISR